MNDEKTPLTPALSPKGRGSKWRRLLVGLAVVVVICLAWWGYHWYTEAHRALARTGALVVDEARAKARQLAAVSEISLLEVANSDLRASLAERNARIEALATAVVYVPEVVYVDRPGTQVEGEPPPADYAGYWSATFPDEAVVGFRLPEERFDLELLPWSADVEIVLDDQGVLGVASLSDRLEIRDVRGIRRVGASEWALGVEGRYPWALAGTVRWSWFRGEVGWDWSRDALAVGLGVEVGL